MASFLGQDAAIDRQSGGRGEGCQSVSAHRDGACQPANALTGTPPVDTFPPTQRSRKADRARPPGRRGCRHPAPRLNSSRSGAGSNRRSDPPPKRTSATSATSSASRRPRRTTRRATDIASRSAASAIRIALSHLSRIQWFEEQGQIKRNMAGKPSQHVPRGGERYARRGPTGGGEVWRRAGDAASTSRPGTHMAN